MDDASDDDAVTLWEAAGFVVTPEEADVEAVDADELRSQLLRLAALDAASSYVPASSSPSASTAFYDVLRPDWAAALATETFSAGDVHRSYSLPSRSETLVVAFGSLTKAHHAAVHSGEARFEYVGTCQRLGVTHALFLRDPLQAWFLRRGSGFQAALALLSREVAQLGARRVLTIGSSMGGYAAIRAAAELGAAHAGRLRTAAVAFGPQIFVDPLERELLRLPCMEFDAELAALKRAGVALPSLLGVMAAGAARVDVHCGEVSRGDVREAQLLRQRHPRAVDLTVHRRGCSHCVAQHLGREAVDALLSRALAALSHTADCDAARS